MGTKFSPIYVVDQRRDFERIMNAPAQAFMLDTNVFDRVLDGKISLSALAGRRLVVIGIQRDELGKAKEPRRTALLATFEAISPEVEFASSFAFDIEGAGNDQAFWNDGSGNYQKMRKRLHELDPKTKNPLNQERDILIAETALKKGATLVSDDRNLRQVISEFGGCAAEAAQLISLPP